MKYDADEFRREARCWGIEDKPEEQLINEERLALRLRVAVEEAESLRARIARLEKSLKNRDDEMKSVRHRWRSGVAYGDAKRCEKPCGAKFCGDDGFGCRFEADAADFEAGRYSIACGNVEESLVNMIGMIDCCACGSVHREPACEVKA